MIYAHEIIIGNSSLSKIGIQKGAKMDDVFCTFATLIQAIDLALRLKCVDYKQLGLDPCVVQDCSPSEAICKVINHITSRASTLEKALADLQKVVNNLVKASSTGGSSNLVKGNTADTKPGTLVDKIVSDQPGAIAYDTTKNVLVINGFVPIGGIIMMDAAFIGNKFDVTGKGKPDTDACLFAICNGQNGTKNRLGRFPRWATSLTTAGATGGKEKFTVTQKNIADLSLALSGKMDKALSTTENVAAEVGTVSIPAGSGGIGGVFGEVEVITLNGGNRSSATLNMTLNLQHDHGFTLSGEYKNANPEAIDLLPLYIDEIPIQRIK